MSLSNKKISSRFDPSFSAKKVLTALNYPYQEMNDGFLIITPIWAIGDFGSLRYNPENGHWTDSFTDSIGHNLISLIMYLEDIHTNDAASLMMNIFGVRTMCVGSDVPSEELDLRCSIP